MVSYQSQCWAHNSGRTMEQWHDRGVREKEQGLPSGTKHTMSGTITAAAE